MELQAYKAAEFAEPSAVVDSTFHVGRQQTAGEITSPMSRSAHALRRIFDFIIAATLLVLLLPVFIIVSIMIRVDSKGPILFMQYRVGEKGSQFLFYKFRSMVADAEVRRSELKASNEASGPLFKMKKDPRITNCGVWMRKFSIDELPQLLNVLKGDMSLVGPRPALPVEVEQYNAFQHNRLAVKPGMTGLWQVSGRSDLSFDQSIKLDVEYIERQSLWLDFVIILKTFGAVLNGRGAY